MSRYDASWFFEQIESFDSIVIARHVLADGDALGSQFGLKTFLEARYPDKKIYAPGASVGSCAAFFPPADEVSEEVLRSSLLIVLDTSDAARIDEPRWRLCPKSLRVDHHLHIASFCDKELVDEQAAATCEIVALLLKEHGETLSSKTASYLYAGLITDTIHFTISSTTGATLEAAAYLLPFGVDVVTLNQQHFGTTLSDFRYETFLRSRLQQQASFGWAVADAKDYEGYGLCFAQAKEKVFVFAGIAEISIWALFTQMESGDQTKEPLYSASLRSRTIALNDIANAFGGGGHRCACGIKNLTREQIKELIKALAQRSQCEGEK